MSSVKQHIQIPSRVEDIHTVQTAVQQAMRQFAYDDDACFAVKLAIEESVVNAIKHGNKSVPARLVHVDLDVDQHRIRISVRDEGQGFDPTLVPDPTADENLAKPTGRGIMLMRAYMDEISFARNGSEVVMIKRKR